MARPASPTPTDAERAILEVLWKHKEASVRDVADELSRSKPVAYTTVLTMFKILESKGFASHRSEGRAFIYRATLSRVQARSSALRHLLAQFFNDSPAVLAQHLLSEHEVDIGELETLQRKIDAAHAKEGDE